MRYYHRSFLQEPRGGEERGFKLADLPVPSDSSVHPTGSLGSLWVGRCGTHRTPAAPPRRRPAHSTSRCGPAAGRSGPAGCQGPGAQALEPERPGCAVGPAPTAVSVKEIVKSQGTPLYLHSMRVEGRTSRDSISSLLSRSSGGPCLQTEGAPSLVDTGV